MKIKRRKKEKTMKERLLRSLFSSCIQGCSRNFQGHLVFISMKKYEILLRSSNPRVSVRNNYAEYKHGSRGEGAALETSLIHLWDFK